MPFGGKLLNIPAGVAPTEIHQVAECLEFYENDDGTFIVLHFPQEIGWAGRPRLRAPVTREIYEKYRENSN